ncbi:MAG: hypothetical protein ACLFOC_07235 [Campylobacterales bacterium]
MKKILAVLLLVSVGLFAVTFEEAKEACDGGDAIGCINLGFM